MNKLTFTLTVVSSLIIGAFLVLLTPLRFYPLIEPTVTEISPTDFYQKYSANPSAYVFVDVRPESEYREKHALGAVNMPLETLYTQRHVLPKSGKTIALICGGSQASGVGFSYLQHFGFYNLVRVTGGMPAWNAAGLPTAKGTLPNGEKTAALGVLSPVRCS